GKVPLAGYVFQTAVQVPAEAVERAAQFLHVSRVRADPRTAVRAGVVEPLDPIFFGPHEDERVVRKLVERDISWRRNFLLATGKLPDTRPQVSQLTLQILAAGVDVAIESTDPEVHGARFTQVLRRRVVVLGDQFLVHLPGLS